jgi:hypothetical protein
MFGIINYELYRLPFFHYQKKNLAYLLDSAARTMSRLTAEFHPFSPTFSDEWKEHAHLNIILINQGFLNLPDEKPATPKAPTKGSKRKKRC